MSKAPARRIFIAYAGLDREHAIELFDHINPTLPTFLDCRCLLPEDDFDVVVPSTRARCLVTVALISTNTAKAFYQHAELTHAVELERSSHQLRHRLIPVWIDDIPVAQRPFPLMNRQGIRLYEKMTWADVAGDVIDVVERMLQGETSADGSRESKWVRYATVPLQPSISQRRHGRAAGSILTCEPISTDGSWTGSCAASSNGEGAARLANILRRLWSYTRCAGSTEESRTFVHIDGQAIDPLSGRPRLLDE